MCNMKKIIKIMVIVFVCTFGIVGNAQWCEAAVANYKQIAVGENVKYSRDDFFEGDYENFISDDEDSLYHSGYYYTIQVNESGLLSVYSPEQYTPKWVWIESKYVGIEKSAKSDGTINDNEIISMYVTSGTYRLHINYSNIPDEAYFYTKLTTLDSDSIIEEERNNDYEHATSIVCDKKIVGTLGELEDAPVDIDMFKIDIPEAGVISIEEGNDDYISYAVYSEGADGNKKKIIDQVGSKVSVSAGKYYVSVSLNDEDIFCQNYSFKVHFQKNDGSREVENNDSYQNASQMTIGNTIAGSLQSLKDYDYFHLALTESVNVGKFKLITKNVRPDTFVMSVNKLDSATNRLIEICHFSNSSDITKYTPVLPFEKGDYYVVVKSGNDSSDSTIDYEVGYDKVDESECKVSNVCASWDSARDIKIGWSTYYGADGYNVYRMEDDKPVFVKKMDSKYTSYTEKISSYEKPYTYQVKAYFTVGNSTIETLDSNVSTVTFDGDSCKVTNIKATWDGTNKITISWDKYAQVDGYRVYRNTGKGFKFVGVIGKKNSMYTDEIDSLGTTYEYIVKGYFKIDKTKILETLEPTSVSVKIPKIKAPKLKIKTNKNNIVIKTGDIGIGDSVLVYAQKNGRWKKVLVMNGKSVEKIYNKTTQYNKIRARVYKNFGGTAYSAYSKVYIIKSKS